MNGMQYNGCITVENNKCSSSKLIGSPLLEGNIIVTLMLESTRMQEKQAPVGVFEIIEANLFWEEVLGLMEDAHHMKEKL
jgi:hypothetical protein